MIDPIFHGTAQPFLPADHWLLVHWPEHDEGTDEMSCSRCGNAVYHKDNGTVRGWFETGFVLKEAEDLYECHLYCHTCTAYMELWVPQVDQRYWLHDDGTPQYDKAEPESVTWGTE